MRSPVALTIAGLLCAPAAFAQEPTDSTQGWQLQVGAVALMPPAYQGSDEHHLRVIPLLLVDYRERMYVGQSRTGLDMAGGGYLLRTPALRWTVEVGSYLPRTHRRADALAGMDRMHTRPFIGTGLAYSLGPVEATASVASAAEGEHDVLGTVGAATMLPIASGWLLGLGTTATFGDRANVAGEFGVSATEAERRRALLESGDPRLRAGDDRIHAPGGGMKELAADVALMHPLSSRTTMVAFGRVGRLQGDAAESPLVRSRTTVSSGVALVYVLVR